MANGEPTGYEDEPRETFEELPAELHPFLYHHERLNQDLAAEIGYYRRHLGNRCGRGLELGCGTCLLSANLAKLGYTPAGIDIERAMLKNAEPTIRNNLALMDMRALAFRSCFEAALIAQNTLNLLVDVDSIRRCLNEIRKVLISPGRVLAHVYCIGEEQGNRDNRLLQFTMFDHPEGGKIIKESIRSFDSEKRLVTLEQRYKIRRFNSAFPDRNYRTITPLAALNRREWIEIFEHSGFEIESTCSDFSGALRPDSATLHIDARLPRF